MENNKLKEGIRFLAVGAAGANVAQMEMQKISLLCIWVLVMIWM